MGEKMAAKTVTIPTQSSRTRLSCFLSKNAQTSASELGRNKKTGISIFSAIMISTDLGLAGGVFAQNNA